MSTRPERTHHTHRFGEGEVVLYRGVPTVVAECIEDGSLPRYWVRFDSGKVTKAAEEELSSL